MLFAFLSAIFAALTSIFAKIGIKDVDSNLATALRTIVVLAMAWLMVLITGSFDGIGEISRKHCCFWSYPGWPREHLGFATSRPSPWAM